MWRRGMFLLCLYGRQKDPTGTSLTRAPSSLLSNAIGTSGRTKMKLRYPAELFALSLVLIVGWVLGGFRYEWVWGL